MNKLKKNDLIKQENCVIFLGLSMIKTLSMMVVGNLKVVILIFVLSNYSQVKKILTDMREAFWI